MDTCEEGRFRGNCSTCDAPDNSQSYREYDTEHGTPEYRAWEQWFETHLDIPIGQVPFKGWVARDVERRRVSLKVFAWYPDETDKLGGGQTVSHPDRDDDGHWASKGCRYGVHTVQLESAPLPFPVMASVEVS